MRNMTLTAGATLLLTTASYAACPAVTHSDMGGVGAGAFPGQYELAEFEAAAGCTMEFSANPEMDTLNGELRGNPALPALADRIPAEPLVVVPYEEVGAYGGTMHALSNATEAGTSDFLSIRHVNLVRYADDLNTIVPNIAKSWSWNDDFTQLTFNLRAGHKWSDGAPFTSADVKFWYDNLALDSKVIEKPKDYVLVGGEPMTVDTPDALTVVFNLPAPKPGLLAHFATSFAQGFQPKHFLGQYHPDINPDADKLAAECGFENGLAVLSAYFGNSDWTDTPSPMLRTPDQVACLPADTHPTLESHVYVSDTTEGRKLVANPYFHMVDTTGQQLPYISRQDELYANDNEVRLLKLVNAEADYKSQSLTLAGAPQLMDGMENGDYTVQMAPTIAMDVFSFNLTSEDEGKREVFGNLDFRKAMSIAINRDELNEVAFFGQGEAKQYIGFSPTPAFVDPALLSSNTEFDPAGAKALLDGIGMVDTDSDGFRELPNGEKIVLNMQFATQGIAGEVVELVAQNWADVGVQTAVKEVTPDEYRSAQSSNQLDVGMWKKGQPVGIVLGNNELWVPPFENYFGHRTGMLWATWLDSNGAEGIEPPQFVKDLMADVEAFQSAVPGSAEAGEIGARMAAAMAENLLFIGTVQAPNLVYHRNSLVNVAEFKTQSYEYYRTYPYVAPQWFLKN
ncbi:Oligopeptide ABC transporter, periplasmic oligopeptide-binding protein [Candidatus Rhodobacter oscarellae]|uniref:Oligopeptide ABC transporter, periplasmic oligopeptide-binding protein n=1 Tax=Candidatus Rhodobacter oscarellae TaxID=1675527 RepID=A0A0J9E7C3_9RHOB|nr:ABC transporter substrate-binding protein [Candidatus Rhodobacter lobularis]KMW57684.1 Oligopeptide ABC transporter, periplasmic oligopeptide-binding protein [Candidatus Rhodobacter lobularis]